MPNDTSPEFDFGLDTLDYGYDPLAETEADRAAEQEEDEGDFTGTPVTSLVATPASQTETSRVTVDERPASERIEALFKKFNPRRRVLAGILRYVSEPRSAADLDAKVVELQAHDFSVYTAANYAVLLENAGAIVKVDEQGTPFGDSPDREPEIVEVDGALFYKPGPWREVYWLATDAARAHLAADDPMARFKALLDRDVVYLPIYLRILDAAEHEGGVTTPELNALVDNDPLVKDPRLYTAHFTELLERCEALRWEGTWKITEIGQALLNGDIDCPDCAAESEA